MVNWFFSLELGYVVFAMGLLLYALLRSWTMWLVIFSWN